MECNGCNVFDFNVIENICEWLECFVKEFFKRLRDIEFFVDLYREVYKKNI